MSLFFIGCFPLAGPSLQLYGLVLSPSFQEVMVCGRGVDGGLRQPPLLLVRGHGPHRLAQGLRV